MVIEHTIDIKTYLLLLGNSIHFKFLLLRSIKNRQSFDSHFCKLIGDQRYHYINLLFEAK